MYDILWQLVCNEGDRALLFKCPDDREAEVDFQANLLDYRVFEESDTEHWDKPQFLLYLIWSWDITTPVVPAPVVLTTYTWWLEDRYVSCAINVESAYEKEVKHIDMELWDNNVSEVDFYLKDENNTRVVFPITVSWQSVTIWTPSALPSWYTYNLYRLQFYKHSDKDVLYTHSVTKAWEPIRCSWIKMAAWDVLAVKCRNARFSFHVWWEVIQYNKDTWFEMIRDNRIATNAQLVIMNTRLSDIKTAIDQFSIQSATNTSNIVSAIWNISACSW